MTESPRGRPRPRPRDGPPKSGISAVSWTAHALGGRLDDFKEAAGVPGAPFAAGGEGAALQGIPEGLQPALRRRARPERGRTVSRTRVACSPAPRWARCGRSSRAAREPRSLRIDEYFADAVSDHGASSTSGQQDAWLPDGRSPRWGCPGRGQPGRMLMSRGGGLPASCHRRMAGCPKRGTGREVARARAGGGTATRLNGTELTCVAPITHCDPFL